MTYNKIPSKFFTCCILICVCVVLQPYKTKAIAMALKYQDEINAVNGMGLCCPPEDLLVPTNILSYRFVFEDAAHKKNHIPMGKNNPKRVLSEKDGKKCFLYSLSCFADEKGARSFFVEVKKTNPNFEKSVGGWICEGIIDDKDGLVSKPDAFTHFELFEYENCNLSKKFEPKDKLV